MVETRAARQRKLADTTVVVDGVAIVQKHDYFALWVLARQTSVPLPTDAVKVIFRDFLDTGATLELTFRDLDDEATRGRLRKTFHFLISSFVRQEEISLLHLPSHTVFKPFWWKQTVELPDGEERQMFDDQGFWTARGSFDRKIPFPGFVGVEVPDFYDDMVLRNDPTRDLVEEDQDLMISMVRNANVVQVEDGDDDEADDCIYLLEYGDLKWDASWDQSWGIGLPRDDPIFAAIDAFTRGKPDRWFSREGNDVRFRLGEGDTCVVVRNMGCGRREPNRDARGTVLFASDPGFNWRSVGEEPDDFTILKSENSDGPPWQPETEVLGHTDGTFGLNSLMQAVMRTKSHKAEDWYERFGHLEINDDVYERFESEAIFIDIHFDYGS